LENLKCQVDKLQAELSSSWDELSEARQIINHLAKELKSLENSSSELIAVLTSKLKTEQAEHRQPVVQLEKKKQEMEELEKNCQQFRQEIVNVLAPFPQCRSSTEVDMERHQAVVQLEKTTSVTECV